MKGIQVNESGELMLRDGTLAIGDTDEQRAMHVLNATAGEYKETPTLGCNPTRQIGGQTDPFWAVLLGDGCEEMEALCPCDCLRRAGVEADSVSIEGDNITVKIK